MPPSWLRMAGDEAGRRVPQTRLRSSGGCPHLLIPHVIVLVEIAGRAGASLSLLAYLLPSIGRLTGRSVVHQAADAAGAAGFIVNGWRHGALRSVAHNLIWIPIGAFALWRIKPVGVPPP